MEGSQRVSALAAGRILSAMRAANLQKLMLGLDQAEQLAARNRPLETPDGEEMELLGAVAGQMRRSLARFGRRLTPHLEGLEVDLQLLRHLARPLRSLPARGEPPVDAPLPADWFRTRPGCCGGDVSPAGS